MSEQDDVKDDAPGLGEPTEIAEAPPATSDQADGAGDDEVAQTN